MIAFTADGNLALLADGERVHVADVAGQRIGRIEVGFAVDRIATFEDEIWIASRTSLRRYGVDLEHEVIVHGDRELPPGRLLAAASPRAAGIWLGESGAMWLHDDSPVPPAELVVPIAAGRHLAVRPGALEIHENGRVQSLGAAAGELAGATVTGGAALEGGRAAILFMGTRMIVLEVKNGAVQHRVSLERIVEARVGARRGHVVFRLGPRQICIVDAQFGRVLGAWEEPADVIELGVDRSCRWLAVRRKRDDREEIAYHTYRELFSTTDKPPEPVWTHPFPPAMADEPEEPIAAHQPVPQPMTKPRPRPVVDEPTALRVPVLRALEPRAATPIDPEALRVRAFAQLERASQNAQLSPTSPEAELKSIFAPQPVARARSEEADPPIDGLADLEIAAPDVLLAACAPALWPELARVHALLGGPSVRTISLAVGRDAAGDLAALAAAGLVSGLTPDPALVERIRDAAPPPPGPKLDDIEAPRALIQSILDALAIPGPARLVLRGREGSGRRTILAALAALAGRPLAPIDAAALEEKSLRRARIAGALPLVTGLDDTRGEIGRVLDAHPGPIVFRARLGATIPGAVFDLPTLGDPARARVWRRALERHGLDVANADALAARHTAGPGLVERAAAAAAVAPDELSVEKVLRSHVAARLAAGARRQPELPSWSHVVLSAEITDGVLELASRVRHRRAVFEDWGLGDGRRGVTALFVGPSGTGKSTAAGILAAELGWELHRVDLSRAALPDVLEAAEDGEALLLFDDADALVTGKDGGELARAFDRFEGVAIFTSRVAPSAIDPSFARRLTLRVSFPFPDEETREQIWRVHLGPDVPTAGAIDLRALARRHQLSGGAIRDAVVRAAFLAAEETSAVTQSHLERAIAAIET